jgi:15-cis-phytoene synthase
VTSVTKDSTAVDYCINKAIPDGSNLYYATLYDKGRNKDLIVAFHALINELSDIIRECSDPGVARVKLHWWQEEIERLYKRQARHPVTRQMQACFSLDQNQKLSFDTVIEFFNNFIFIEQADSLDTILSLYQTTSGEIWYQCVNQLQSAELDCSKDIKEIGALYHFINCLQQPDTYLNETRCIIPESYINLTELLNLRVDSTNRQVKQNEIFRPLLIDLKTRLDEVYEKLNKERNHVLQHTLILNRLAFKTCDEILRDGCNILDTNISLTPVRKLWVAWWTHFTMK